MDLFSFGSQMKLNIGDKSDRDENRMDLHLGFNGWNRRRCGGQGFAARMFSTTHVAIACHFLAAVHLRLCHLRIGQASERRRGNPNRKERQHDNGPSPRHNYMLPFRESTRNGLRLLGKKLETGEDGELKGKSADRRDIH